MRWDELEEGDFINQQDHHHQQQDTSHLNFDFDYLSLISKPKDYYRILEVDYEATEDEIRSNFIRLALKWHPDKQKGEDSATSKFQEINEAYQVLSDPIRKEEYDRKGMLYLYDYNIVDYLNRYKGLILTCSGLGMNNSIL
ncbi:dnaJ-related protein SCJ1-like [Rutidosis leptorrhynchoides]|uniref:dnaJ-related protein SCJ1-like n=1 Tax=Rutidosis leptorrhynchoides TaxID=125765 RepID=UPI003A98DA60